MTSPLVRTRHATATDVDALVDLHARCSPDTLHRRFHVETPRVPRDLVEQLVAPPGGWSMLAERQDRVVALASAAPLDPGRVEVGLVVEDRHQATGIGSRLVRELAREAQARGYDAMTCLVQPDNASALPTVRRAGLDALPTLVDGTVHLTVPLPVRRRGRHRTAGSPDRPTGWAPTRVPA